jgi:hypothetical protein
MTEIKCNKCKQTIDLDNLDYLNADMIDEADDSIQFYFNIYCENEVEVYDAEDNEYYEEECEAKIEVIRYATLQEYVDVEQEE